MEDTQNYVTTFSLHSPFYKTAHFRCQRNLKLHFCKCDRVTGYVLSHLESHHIHWIFYSMYVSSFVLEESLLEQNAFSWIPGRLDVSLFKLVTNLNNETSSRKLGVPVYGLEEPVASNPRVWSTLIANPSHGVLFQELERANQGYDIVI